MPEMTLTEAAQWAGVSRPTMFKAIKKGRISAEKNQSGEYRINPAELERAFPPAGLAIAKPVATETTGTSAELDAKYREIALLKDALADAREQRDKAMALVETQTRVLTDQRSKTGWRFWK